MNTEGKLKHRGKTSVVVTFLAIVSAIFVVCTMRLFSLQIVRGEEYKNNTRENSIKSTPIPALRGEIFDRNMNPLAVNENSFVIEMIPGEIPLKPRDEYDTVASKLAELLGIAKKDVDKQVLGVSYDDFVKLEENKKSRIAELEAKKNSDIEELGEEKRNEIEREFEDEKRKAEKQYDDNVKALNAQRARNRKSYGSFVVKSYVPFETVSNIAEHLHELKGVSYISRPLRRYLETNSFSHILGYVGKIGKEEVKKLYNKVREDDGSKMYNEQSIIGKSGIELQYDMELQGKDGERPMIKDARGRIVSGEKPEETSPVSGNKVVITIDSRIQKLAEEALGERIGAVVVLKPSTGEILAMVSYPYYDSNIFVSERFVEEYTKLSGDKDTPLLNRAVNAVYPPASTFKIVMNAAILSEKAISPMERIECPGEIEFGGRIWKCWILKPGHGWMNLRNAIAHSCDIYYWDVGREKLGPDKISYHAKEFGYAKSSEIDLPSQAIGSFPTPELKWKKTHGGDAWRDGDTMNISIGQGAIQATPLQVANVMAMVSNSGVVYKPHLLKKIIPNGKDESEVKDVEPKELLKSKLDESVWKQIQDDLRYAVTDGATRHTLTNRAVKMAAKTGTAEVNIQGRYHSWLLAYAPWDAPPEDRIVVATIVEAANQWESWATYATNIIMQGIFANQTFDEAVNALGWRQLVDSRRTVARAENE